MLLRGQIGNQHPDGGSAVFRQRVESHIGWHQFTVRTPQPQFQLFDLAKDPGEKTDVFAKNPEVGEKLKARLAAIVAASRSR